MLEISLENEINQQSILLQPVWKTEGKSSKLSFNTKNDKAFASSGNITNKFMSSKNLTLPRIKKSEIKNIILGGGQNLLSPERRFDAIIYNSPELFL